MTLRPVSFVISERIIVFFGKYLLPGTMGVTVFINCTLDVNNRDR